MYTRVLVGADGSATATRAVTAAARLAQAHGAELIVAHAYAPRLTPEQRCAWDEAPDELRWRLSSGSIAEETVHAAVRHATAVTDGTIGVHGRWVPGRPIPVLLSLIEALNPDVFVVGNRDMPARLRTRRSVSRALSRRAGCDVVIADTLGRSEQRRRAARAALAPQLA